jgi:hypothetical protein
LWKTTASGAYERTGVVPAFPLPTPPPKAGGREGGDGGFRVLADSPWKNDRGGAIVGVRGQAHHRGLRDAQRAPRARRMPWGGLGARSG